MRRPVRPALTGLRQGGDIASISLNAPTALSVHRRVVRIRHHDLVADLFKMLGNPFALRGGLDQDAHAWATPEHLRQALARRRNALVDHLPTLCDNTNLTFLLVEV